MPTLTISHEGEGVRVDRYLRRMGFYFPQNLFEKWSRQSKLLLNNQKAKPASRLKNGDILVFPDDAVPIPPPETTTPLAMTQEEAFGKLRNMILFENDDFIVLNKPTGLATQGGTGQRISVDDILRAASPEARLRLTHRLDKETSGLLLVAKNSQTATKLTNAFRDRSVTKTYIALCDGIMKTKKGRIEGSLKKSETSFEKMVPVSSLSKDARHAMTDFEVIAIEGNISKVALYPYTGRTHQLRVHMASIGHPIQGDVKYGGSPFKRLMLHAWKISFAFGEDESTYVFEAPQPKYFAF